MCFFCRVAVFSQQSPSTTSCHIYQAYWKTQFPLKFQNSLPSDFAVSDAVIWQVTRKQDQIGSDKNFSWDFHLGINTVGNLICVVLWTVKLHLWYISIGSTFLKTCWVLPVIKIRHTFSLGKINSTPLRNRLLVDLLAQILTPGLEIFCQ